ncbi:unnamed protein product [Angiostrongylus costaricensis]|uniref:Tyrosine-protein phosphatase domain-containing protein n=1 Tax=Angiostrongylus costaricensis TaxID=334426 RepID=A0A158PGZ3_ANGCS|nr:unnamed protein product [Angiostrongylus costaricensis]
MSSDRKSLLSVGSEVRGMRNWPLFVFLGGLVFFFYFLYVYQAQSTEYAIIRSELENQLRKVQDLKVDFVSAKAENERLQAVQSELKNEKDKLSRDFGTCSSALRSCKLNIETLQSENIMLEKQSRNKDVINEGLQQKIEELTKNGESLKKAISDQDAVVDQLKGTIRKLEAELNRTKFTSTDKGSTFVVDQSGTTKFGSIQVDTTSVTKRTVEVTREQRRIVDDKQIDQAPAPMILESDVETVKQKTGTREIIGDEHGPDVPPQKPGDRVKLAVAADERSKDEKPVVKGGNYDEPFYTNLFWLAFQKLLWMVTIRRNAFVFSLPHIHTELHINVIPFKAAKSFYEPCQLSKLLKNIMNLGNVVLVRNRGRTSRASEANAISPDRQKAQTPTKYVYGSGYPPLDANMVPLARTTPLSAAMAPIPSGTSGSTTTQAAATGATTPLAATTTGTTTVVTSAATTSALRPSSVSLEKTDELTKKEVDPEKSCCDKSQKWKAYMEKAIEGGSEAMQADFRLIRGYLPPTATRTAFDANMEKNRFEAIIRLMKMSPFFSVVPFRKYAYPHVYMSLSGCGRAGTYAAFEIAHERLHSDSFIKVNVNDCICRVRNGRMHAVQRPIQMQTIHACIMEHIMTTKFASQLSPKTVSKYEEYSTRFNKCAELQEDMP